MIAISRAFSKAISWAFSRAISWASQRQSVGLSHGQTKQSVGLFQRQSAGLSQRQTISWSFSKTISWAFSKADNQLGLFKADNQPLRSVMCSFLSQAVLPAPHWWFHCARRNKHVLRLTLFLCTRVVLFSNIKLCIHGTVVDFMQCDYSVKVNKPSASKLWENWNGKTETGQSKQKTKQRVGRIGGKI